MKKIVYESLEEFNQNTQSLNEFRGLGGQIKKGYEKVSQFIKDTFKKVGDFFVALSDGEPVDGVQLPINTGILVDQGALSPAISYLPSQVDLELEPGLASETAEDIIAKRGPEDLKKMEESLMAILEDKIRLEHPDTKRMPNVDTEELVEEIEMAMMNPLDPPLMIWGAPGIGKTKIVNSVLKAKGEGQRLIDVQTSKMAPDDWALPAIHKNMEVGKEGEWVAMDVPKNWLPVYIPTDDPKENKKRNDAANQGNGGIIFFDELSRADEAVQNTCLKVMDERIIGESMLGDKWVLIAAANREEDDPESGINFGRALGNRFSQINFVPDFESWKGWAMDNVDPRIVDFLEFNLDDFFTLDDDALQSIFASPRGWARASKSLGKVMQRANDTGQKLTKRDISRSIGKDVGLDIAERFAAFLRLMEEYSKEDIKMILTDADKARTPKKAGSGYDLAESNALMSLVVTSTKDRDLTPEEFIQFGKYLVKLNNSSLASAAMKKMFHYHPKMHEELGERPGKDKYQEGYDIFDAKYKDAF